MEIGVGGGGRRGAGGGRSGTGPPSTAPSSFHPRASGSGPSGSQKARGAGARRLEAGRQLSRSLRGPHCPHLRLLCPPNSHPATRPGATPYRPSLKSAVGEL